MVFVFFFIRKNCLLFFIFIGKYYEICFKFIHIYSYEEPPFSNQTTGCPYVWAQQICGLDFLSTSSEIFPSCSDGSSSSKRDLKRDSIYTERAIKAIRSRLVARIHLTQQIASLGKLFF